MTRAEEPHGGAHCKSFLTISLLTCSCSHTKASEIAALTQESGAGKKRILETCRGQIAYGG